MTKEEESSLSTTAFSFTSGGKTRKKRILIVDDEPDIVLALKAILEEDGFEVDSFTDPSLALNEFAADTYSLAVLDIKMPKMNGFELSEKLMAIDNKVKIIFLTAATELKAYDAFKKTNYARHANRHFIYKPVENKDLLHQVNLMISMNPNDTTTTA